MSEEKNQGGNDTVKTKRVLVLADSLGEAETVFGPPAPWVERILLRDKTALVSYRDGGKYDGLIIASDETGNFLKLRNNLLDYALLDLLPVGLLIIGTDLKVIRANRQFAVWAGVPPSQVVGKSFYAMLGMPSLTGRDTAPFHHAGTKKQPVETTMQHRERQQFFQMNVTPVLDGDDVRLFVVVLRDIAPLIEIDRKFKAIQEAGKDLADISAELLLSLTIEERIQLLKEKIIQYTEDILHYDKIEIRLLSHEVRGRLEPLLAVGMDEEASHRELYAYPEGNGVTGFVAYHAKRYLVENAEEDPFYLQGVAGARSSMTVPLLIHGRVIGTFNVESLEPRAFSETDIEFLEAFARDIAQALHTMELFTVEQSDAFVRSVETIHAAVAVPINAIVNEAVQVFADQGDLDPDAADRLRKILKNARDVQMLIQSVGDKMVPAQGHPVPPGSKHPLLEKKKILVVDADENVGLSVRAMLFWYGCVVEMVPTVSQALVLAKNMQFDLYLSDIRPPDLSGYDLLLKLREQTGLNYVPLILMKGYGYDKEHVTVKARQAGVTGFLAKPFILDQVVSTIERVLEEAAKPDAT